MSILFYAEKVRATITNVDINGQGSEARLDPGAPLTIKGEIKVQNPAELGTDTVQIILFLDDKFLKCIYNDVPAREPNFTTGSFEFSCPMPVAEGKYALRAGWAYNWNWPDQAYNYLLAYPEPIENIGVLTVGVEEKPVSLLPAVLFAIPIGTIITLALPKKKV